ncbi:MAG: hypothetical protein HGB20_10210 [Chlorobiaceae bacterium]|nr:hypothetical protein [Chlorobiaceae bacterium]
MAETRFLRLRRVLVAFLFFFALSFPPDVFALGENSGTVRSTTLRLLRTEGTTDILRATVIVESSADGCGPYNVSLFISRNGGESYSVGSDRGTAMGPGMNRAHSVTISQKHRPGTRYVLTGYVVWGPDAQIPIPETRYEVPPVPR